MAFEDPDSFDVFRRGEPSLSLLGIEGTTGLDIFRRGEPAVSILRYDEPPPPPQQIPMLVLRVTRA